MSGFTPHPALDLVLERTIPVQPERVWAAWTQPELLMRWFTPAPWKTVAADLDVRPGGRCITTMESPDGDQYPNSGCYLQVEPNRLLVFTSAMTEASPSIFTSLASGSALEMFAHVTPASVSCLPNISLPSSNSSASV